MQIKSILIFLLIFSFSFIVIMTFLYYIHRINNYNIIVESDIDDDTTANVFEKFFNYKSKKKKKF